MPFQTPAHVTVGTSNVQVDSTDRGNVHLAIYTAHPDNDGVIFIVDDASATTGEGVPLSAGDSFPIKLNDAVYGSISPDEVYAIADGADQTLCVFYQ